MNERSFFNETAAHLINMCTQAMLEGEFESLEITMHQFSTEPKRALRIWYKDSAQSKYCAVALYSTMNPAQLKRESSMLIDALHSTQRGEGGR